MRFLIVTLMLLANFAFAGEAKSSSEIVLTEDNTLVLNDAFSGKSVSELIGEAKKMDAELKSGYPIYLFLDTPGGEIRAGLELIEFLKGLNRPIHTVTLFAASMGFQLVQHLGDRLVLEYGVLMSHKAAGGFRGEFGGESSQIDSRYGLWLRMINKMDKKTTNRTNGKKTLKQYQSEYDNELWLTGEEAVKNGYADRVVSVKCSSSLSGAVEKDIRLRGLKISVKLDKCPIRTYPMSIKVNIRTNKGYVELEDFLNKGGKFGKDCLEKVVDTETDWRGDAVVKEVKSELCSTDKSLTLKKVDEIVEKETDKISKRKRGLVKMSFSSFVSE